MKFVDHNRVLIVDDEGSNRSLYQFILQDAGNSPLTKSALDTSGLV